MDNVNNYYFIEVHRIDRDNIITISVYMVQASNSTDALMMGFWKLHKMKNSVILDCRVKVHV